MNTWLMSLTPKSTYCPSGWEMVSTGPLWTSDNQVWTQQKYSALVFLLFLPWDHFYILHSGYVRIPQGLKSKWGWVTVPCFTHICFKFTHTSVYFLTRLSLKCHDRLLIIFWCINFPWTIEKGGNLHIFP